jgi:uncharacterized membrane protein
MATIGIWGLAHGGFVAIWAPGIRPAALVRPAAVACSLISLVTGAGLLWPRSKLVSARILLAFLILWLLWCKLAVLVHASASPASWESLGETAVLVAAAWALSFDESRACPASPALRAGAVPRIIYGLSLIAFAAGHLGYPTLTASLVPALLPWHLTWVYLTAATYTAAGIALLARRLSWSAAILSALQMALFGVLVWLPRIVAGARDMDTLNETAITFALAACGWVVANAVRSAPNWPKVTSVTLDGDAGPPTSAP